MNTQDTHANTADTHRQANTADTHLHTNPVARAHEAVFRAEEAIDRLSVAQQQLYEEHLDRTLDAFDRFAQDTEDPTPENIAAAEARLLDTLHRIAAERSDTIRAMYDGIIDEIDRPRQILAQATDETAAPDMIAAEPDAPTHNP